MNILKFICSFAESEIFLNAVTAVITVITKKTLGVFKRRRKSKKKLKKILSKVMRCEEKTNYLLVPKTNYVNDHDSYFDVLTELKTFTETHELTFLRKESDLRKESEKLIEEINRKLIIYENAFIKDDDIRQTERNLYGYLYVEPDETKIQRLAGKLLKRLRFML